MKKKETEHFHELLIIGAGASGLMAAIRAARQGVDVALLEHTDKIGRKLLITGNGRCNLTNQIQRPEYYRSHHCQTAWQIVSKFTKDDTIAFFQELGLLLRERSGGIYPWSNQAASVLRVLKSELYYLGIPIYYRAEPIKLYKDKKRGCFCCETEGARYFGKKLILAAGSKAAEKTGSDGSGYALAHMLGHSIYPPLPALVPLIAKEPYFRRLAGVRAEGKITLYGNGREMASDIGELQITEYGISGIPAFQVSRYAAEALYEKKHVTAELDFCPCLTVQELEYRIEKQKKKGIRTREALIGILNEKLADELHTRTENRKELAERIKCFPATITGTKGFDFCQVCAGGVPLTEIDPETMESKREKGLYLAGELLDVDGACGGYNLQWAWASGHLAGASAAAGIKGEYIL